MQRVCVSVCRIVAPNFYLTIIFEDQAFKDHPLISGGT